MTSPLPPSASLLQKKRAAVFLDRDGTLNVQVVRGGKPYPPATLEDFRLFPGVAGDCARLKAAGYVLVVATNQPDVGRGTQDRAVVEAMHARLRQLVPTLDAIQVCYHAGEAHGQPCACRKPKPGMLLAAARELGLDLARSWMVGDRWGDIDAGHAAGCRTILVDHGYSERAPAQPPEFTVKSLSAAVGIILADPLAGPIH
ncbi:MAG TPA: HAD family hydrolase [Lacunisphaera sp.]|nr:HAD family hydrolase [Lacunisphaera sp.]